MKHFKYGALCMAAILALTFIGTPKAYAATAGTGEIIVSGAGSISIAPDVAYVTLGVTTQNASPKVAQTENNQLIASVIETVKKLGIDEKDIKTTNYNMYPNYDYSKMDGSNRITGYTVNNSVSVTVRDLEKLGDLLGVAVDAGANVSNGVSFGLLDRSAAYNEALTLAIRNAADKASTIAKALGKSVGDPITVTESGGSYMPVYSTEMRAMPAADAAMGVPTEAGELTVTANVQITYSYK